MYTVWGSTLPKIIHCIQMIQYDNMDNVLVVNNSATYRKCDGCS